MLSGSALAVEKQQHLGIGGGLSLLKIDDKSTMSIGGVVGLHYAYGLSDAFNFVAEGGVAPVARGEAKGPDIPPTRPENIAHVGAGATYVIDVGLDWVPYVGALGTGYLLNGGSLDGSKLGFGVALAAGLDYQISRSWAAGVAFRQHEILTSLGTYPSYTEGLLRVEFVWGW